jgi:hypothetical protein
MNNFKLITIVQLKRFNFSKFSNGAKQLRDFFKICLNILQNK